MSSPVNTSLLRRFIVLSVLLLLMLGAEALGTPETGTKPLVLAAIGFVILASFSVAETASTLSLPRVTGYIITGAVLYQTGILSSAVADELQMFNTLALGLIAIGAGLELSVSSLKRLSRTLLATAAAKVLLTAPLVAGAAYGYVTFAPRLGLPAPDLPSSQAVMAFALVIGALSIGTSPSIALAVISESRSKGRVSDLVLGASVLKDIVVVVVLAVAVAMATGLLGGGEVDPSALRAVGREVAYSLLAGAVLGGLLIAYIRYVNAEMLLFVGAMILSVAELSKWLHFELLLVFIAGGFVVRNFSSYEHELSRPVNLVSLPIFVVFFTIAGAHIDLRTTLLFLPFALMLAGVRAVGFRWSAALGNRVGGEGPVVRQNVWLGYLPQAGVTLGLLGLASVELPPLAAALKSGGMAFVAVNLLVGPIALRFALRRAGEASGAAAEEALTHTDELGAARQLPPELTGPLDATVSRLESEVIAPALQAHGRWAELVADACLDIASALSESGDGAKERWNELRSSMQALDADDARDFYVQARAIVRFVPPLVVVPQVAGALRLQADDPGPVRRRKRVMRTVLWLTFRKPPPRQVPLLELARECFEPRLAELSSKLWASKLRLCAALLEDIATHQRLRADADDVAARIRVRVEEWRDDIEQELKGLPRRAMAQLSPLAQRIDTPYLPRRKHPKARVDDQVRAAFTLFGTTESWLQALDADWARLSAIHQLADLGRELERRALSHVSETVERSLQRLMTRLAIWREDASSLVVEVPGADYLERCEAYQGGLRESPRALVEATTADLRRALDLRPLTHWLEQRLQQLPTTVTLTTAAASPSTTLQPSELTYRTLELRRITETLLLKNALTTLEANAQAFENVFRTTCGRLLRAQDDFRVALRAVGLDSTRSRDQAVDAMRRLRDTYLRCEAELTEQVSALAKSEAETVSEAVSAANTSVLLESGVRSPQTRREYWLALLRLARSRTRRTLASAIDAGQTWWKNTGGRLFGGVMLEFAARSGDRVLDAQTLRSTLESLQTVQNADYATFFQLEPIRDPGHFVANSQVLAALATAESLWLKGGVASALVVGEHGSGKSSLLNMLQYRAAAPRVLRLEPLEWRRQVGVIRALAYSLDCSPDPVALKAALQKTRTHVLIDDVEQWVPAGQKGVDEVVRILELVCATRESSFWTVTINRDYFELLRQAVDLTTGFGTVTKISPLSRSQVREMLEARHAESGRTLELPRTISSWLRWDAMSPGDHEVIYELIRGTTGGNLSRALILWTLLTRVDEDGCVRLHASRAPLAVSLPFLRNLEGEQLALLALLNRVGPLSATELSEQLHVSHSQLFRLLSFFDAGGLLVRAEASGLISVHPRCSALAALGLKGLSAA